jgi:hypothetical protein
MLNIYISLTKAMIDMEEDKEAYGDVYHSYKNQITEVFNKIDPSIRVKLMKKGVSLIMNTYAGFDTEYVNIEMGLNKLLSVQLAASSKIILKIPKVTYYT